MIERKKTKLIMLGGIPIGGGAPITVQTMTNTKTSDLEATSSQIMDVECAGCDIVRVSVPDEESARAISELKKRTKMPIVADVHFDWRLAVLALENGADGVRVNPGTIKSRNGLKRIAKVARQFDAVVRVGVNSGSLERRFRGSGLAEARALALSAMDGVKFFEDEGVQKIKISVKAPEVPLTLEAYEIVSESTSWPLHVGITEAGTLLSGTIRSAVGIGAILSRGIGDTIRVSLSASPVEEVRVGRKILEALELAKPGPRVISCPTCARAQVDVIEIANEVERILEGFEGGITVAVMGCQVNGPGEAREADVGIAGGKEGVLLFSRAKMLRRVSREDALDELLSEVQRFCEGRNKTGDCDV